MVRVIGLGQAFELRWRSTLEASEQVAKFSKAWWWAWDGNPTAGTLRLVKVIGRADGRVSATAAGQHIRFHGGQPNEYLAVDSHAALAPLTPLGFCTAVAYDARGFSTTKGDRPYRHRFGDFGRDGDGDQSNDPTFWPALVIDARERLYLRRRAGNRFSLADWLIG